MNTRLEELLRGFEAGNDRDEGMGAVLYGETYDLQKLEKQGFSVSMVDQHGGEGQGDQIWAVFMFTEDATGEETHIRFDGWYASYVGSEYNSFCEVRPIQVTKTEYERV